MLALEGLPDLVPKRGPIPLPLVTYWDPPKGTYLGTRIHPILDTFLHGIYDHMYYYGRSTHIRRSPDRVSIWTLQMVLFTSTHLPRNIGEYAVGSACAWCARGEVV